MKNILLIIFGVLIASCHNKSIPPKDYSDTIHKIKAFAEENQYNQNVAFFIDYSLHSGLSRFFVVDLKTNKITHKKLVSHGDCKGKNDNNYAKVFSNTNESNCTSLGFSSVGKRAYSKWGKNYKYWLNGLESTNSNMKKRVVVLHAWSEIPDTPVYPKSIANSFGCPTVSIAFLDTLDDILKNNKKVLLYSFN